MRLSDYRRKRRFGHSPEPLGEYGAGGVIVWDRGTYTNATIYEMTEGLERGHLSSRLHGEKLSGGYTLTRIREGEQETWLLINARARTRTRGSSRC
jgi:DNA ligase D-like protein (predicted 3'-phosphoesterase)